MARVELTKHLQRFCEATDGDAPGATIGEVLDAFFAAQPSARPYILDEHGRVRRHVVIFHNDEQMTDRSDLSQTVTDTDTDTIHVMQALSGG